MKMKELNYTFKRKAEYVINKYPKADEEHLLKMLTLLVNNKKNKRR